MVQDGPEETGQQAIQREARQLMWEAGRDPVLVRPMLSRQHEVLSLEGATARFLGMNETMPVRWRPIGEVFLSPKNPRQNDAGVEPVAASLRRFGWQQPIVVRSDGEVIAGNTRLRAAQLLGMERVPVVEFEGTEADARAFQIADNRTHEFSQWDEPALAVLLRDLQAEDELEAVGFNDAEIEELISQLEHAADGPVEDPGPGDPPEVPTSRRGDIWYLGTHRLMCGDSTSSADVTNLMLGESGALMATDPPYCVDYTGIRPSDSGKDWGTAFDSEIPDLGVFLSTALTAWLPKLVDDAGIYIWHAHVRLPTILEVFERHGLLLHQVLVWVKPTATFGHSYYRWRHEPCAFGWRRGHKPKHLNEQADTIWEADWDGKARLVGNKHPTQKPTRLFEIPMEQHTKVGAIVVEPFSGSGSQLIAAEIQGRRCRAMEITPAFVDVAVDRWQLATNKQAHLGGLEGPTFAEVARERKAEAHT